MCNEIAISTGLKCLLEPKQPICHSHKRIQASREIEELKKLNMEKLLESKQKQLKKNKYLKDEIRNLNKTIQRKTHSLEEQFQRNNELREEHKVELREHKFIINELQEQNDILKEEKEAMRADFENYQFIKRFEAIKFKLKKYVNIRNNNHISFFCMQRKNIPILRTIMGEQKDYYTYFNSLRAKRNKLSHWYY